jgi:type II secretory pathway pseudopilin PulG
MFSKKTRIKRSFFSLIELLIVIGIMGVLTALILPQFSAVEADSKDTGCDYNNAGTLRYVTMFKGANGYYPTGFHTGLDNSHAVYGTDSYGIDPTSANMNKGCTIAALTDAGTGEGEYLTSMKAAGIISLAYGSHTAEAISGVSVAKITADWAEDSSGGTGTEATIGTETLTFNGQTFTELASGEGPGKKAGIIIPLFAASTIDWENYYGPDSAINSPLGESKVGVALPGKCPWPEDGKLRYYICFFKAFGDGSPAKLVGTCCPECGPLHAGTF